MFPYSVRDCLKVPDSLQYRHTHTNTHRHGHAFFETFRTSELEFHTSCFGTRLKRSNGLWLLSMMDSTDTCAEETANKADIRESRHTCHFKRKEIIYWIFRNAHTQIHREHDCDFFVLVVRHLTAGCIWKDLKLVCVQVRVWYVHVCVNT